MSDVRLLDSPSKPTASKPKNRGPRASRGSVVLTWALRVLVVGYLFLLVAWPVSLVITHAFAGGIDTVTSVLGDADVQTALRLTVFVAVIAVVINTIFGVGMALLLVRKEFWG